MSAQFDFAWELFDEQDEPHEVVVTATFHGEHYPAIMYPTDRAQPEEWPELEFEVVDAYGRDVTDTLSPQQVQELDQRCWDEYEERRNY
jgi:hypothetical protein